MRLRGTPSGAWRVLLTAVLTVATGAAIGVATTAAAAPNGGECRQWDNRTARCLVYGTAPGKATSGRTGSTGGGSPDCVTEYGVTVTCSGPLGTWSQTRHCYLRAMDPQPPRTDWFWVPLWMGHTDGAIYTCAFPGAPGGMAAGTEIFWLPQPPPVDPAVLAQQVVADLDLRAIEIGIAPRPGAGSMGYVGLPVYLWVDQPGPQTFGPVTRSASAGGVTVTVTARVQEVRWSMGDGHTVVCAGPGTPYRDAFGGKPSPDCGHTYTAPRDPYPVTATSHWVVTWAGGGQSGTIPLDLTATTQIRIGEVQVLVQ